MRDFDFSPLFRTAIGFDRLPGLIDSAMRSSVAVDSYPPYNIEQIGLDSLRITLAVAGFTETDLSIELEDNQLLIRGRQTDDTDRVYLHRGIAARQFQRSFVLADGVEVTSASLDSGLLHIDVSLPRPERNVRKIEIDGAGSPALDVETNGGAS